MLITYLENGDFEYRAPRVEHSFSGEIGNAANAYLESCKNVLAQPTYLSKKTTCGVLLIISRKRTYTS